MQEGQLEILNDSGVRRAYVQRQIAKAILRNGMDILEKKGHDYAEDDDAFSNFRFVGLMLDEAIRQGLRGAHLSFLTLIGTKLARIIQLLAADKEPNNESIEDTFTDLDNYGALWGSFVLTERRDEVAA